MKKSGRPRPLLDPQPTKTQAAWPLTWLHKRDGWAAFHFDKATSCQAILIGINLKARRGGLLFFPDARSKVDEIGRAHV